MKIIKLIFIFLFIIPSFSGVLIKEKDELKDPGYGIPFIVFSTTLKVENSTKQAIHSSILSILQDGTALMKLTLDNRNNLSLSKDKRILSTINIGPLILTEKIRGALQRFFSESYNWTLLPKSFVSQKIKDNYIWLAELSLYYGSIHHTCFFSNVEKKYPEIPTPAFEFLQLLDQIVLWMEEENSKNQNNQKPKQIL